MTYLVTGAGGQLGRMVLAEARRRGRSAVGLSHAALAVENRAAVHETVLRVQPEFVFHCAAWTDVDGCETDPERAARVNALGTANMVEACVEVGAGLICVSSDFVFDGSKREPYREDDTPRPLSVYGRSKLEGERAVLSSDRARFYVVRTSWVFGPGGRNFPSAILERARGSEPLRVVDDQVGRPTLSCDLAEALVDLAVSEAASGIYHAANEGVCSWHEFAGQILAGAGLGDTPVGHLRSADLGRPAQRPAYSVLDCSRLAVVRGRRLPHYLDALSRYLAELVA